MLFLAPWTGSAADRFDRRKLLLVTQPLAAALSGALALVTALDLATAALVISFGLGQGVVSAFSTPAQQALFISLVRREDVTAAVALGNLYFFSLAVFGMGTLMVLDPVAAQAVGARDIPAVARALQRGVLLAALLTLPTVARAAGAAHGGGPRAGPGAATG